MGSSRWFGITAKLLRSSCQKNTLFDNFLHTTPVRLKTTVKNLKGRKTSSQQWLRRQLNDPYVVQSRLQQWRCRSAFKLMEIDDKNHIFRQGDVVIDCGAHPGSWSQVAVQRVNATGEDSEAEVGFVIGIDMAQTAPLSGAQIITGDFTLPDVQQKISKILMGKQASVVLSDMAPRACGIKSLDHEIIVDLARTALTFSHTVLKQGGHFVCKLWDGNETKALEELMKTYFHTVKRMVPNASRKESKELYLLGIGYSKKMDKS
ncbi:rRNA methyltransferase 2, mitochondrial-like [Lingula anatina]|uniref:rRNA methyltransferase 2, mitochondrial n=1 Tax=Lingula anatina TaxID=7574 RepID=A0A1S3HJ11_LINAN|nr:rRNA methyltransferase 2, mitochondrial-like [Lingula anatina]|eukprot:XP_013384984.1 rRNA methyltransferase 2, mitochondrial-like [Lingula anatina]